MSNDSNNDDLSLDIDIQLHFKYGSNRSILRRLATYISDRYEFSTWNDYEFVTLKDYPIEERARFSTAYVIKHIGDVPHEITRAELIGRVTDLVKEAHRTLEHRLKVQDRLNRLAARSLVKVDLSLDPDQVIAALRDIEEPQE